MSVDFCFSDPFVCSGSLICWILKIKSEKRPFPFRNCILRDVCSLFQAAVKDLGFRWNKLC